MHKYFIFLISLNLFLFIFNLKIAKLYNLYDKPDKKRKFHKFATPLTGGLIIFINLIFYFIYVLINNDYVYSEYYYSNKTLFIFILLSFSTFIIGYLDDKFDISANKKFIILLFIIYFSILFDKNLIINDLSFQFTNKEIFLENFSALFSVLCIMLFINAFNMFDGINSQASSYATLLILVLIFKGINFNFLYTLLIPLILATIYNYNDKMFLGNTGSLLISTILSLLFILSYKENKFFADEIFLFLVFPGLDLFRLFINRLMKNKNPFSADTNHLHHLIIKRCNLLTTLSLTVGMQGLIFLIYLYNQIYAIYFIIFLVIYYFTLYLVFKNKNYL